MPEVTAATKPPANEFTSRRPLTADCGGRLGYKDSSEHHGLIRLTMSEPARVSLGDELKVSSSEWGIRDNANLGWIQASQQLGKCARRHGQLQGQGHTQGKRH